MHPSLDELMAEAVSDETARHLEGCAECRVERARLVEVLNETDPGSFDPHAPTSSLLDRWSFAVAHVAQSDGARGRLLAGDGLVPIRLEPVDGGSVLTAELGAASPDLVRARFEALRSLVHPAMLTWTELVDGVARARAPAVHPLEEGLAIDLQAGLRLAGHAALAVAELHARGTTHGALADAIVGITSAGRLLVAPPALHREVSEAEDLAQLGTLFRSLATPALGELGERLEQSPERSVLTVIDELLELSDAARQGAGRYARESRLGAGGVGEVWRARDLLLDRTVAIKVQRDDRRDDTAFAREARLTASLQHPGIVPIHQVGTLDDGRVFYTMEEVEGPDLSEVLAELHRASAGEWREGGSGWTLRRIAEAVARVADAVGYAHSRGIVHCDVKPANIKLGPHGEVRLMDWGMAVPQGSRPIGGTPAYMAPEHQRREPVGPAGDVFALGRVLQDLVLGPGARVPREDAPPVPEELRQLADRCLAASPDERPADGSRVAEEIRAWLDGRRRAERAREALQRVDDMAARAASLEERAEDLRARARAQLAEVPSWAPAEDKAPAWDLEDRAAALEREAAVCRTAHEQGVRAALELDPGYRDALDALAAIYRDGLRRAEARADEPERARFATLLEQHDGGRHAAWLRGDGALTLHTDPPGASVLVERYEPRQRRLVAAPWAEIGPTPLDEHRLPRGSYLLRIRHPDCEEVRLPVRLGRGEHHDGRGPDGHLVPVRLPPRGSLRPDECYVPAGWFVAGGDPEAPESLPPRRLWVPGFVIGRHPVTVAEYVEVLDRMVADGDAELAERCEPREDIGMTESGRPVLGRSPDGRFLPTALTPDGVPWRPDWPVTLDDQPSINAFLRHLSARDGRPWRLPHELEWEKAARGADQRAFPWGNHLDPSFANMAKSAQPPCRGPVGAFERDESPYGVRGLGGNVRDRCANGYARDYAAPDRLDEWPADHGDPDLRVSRGGAWLNTAALCRAATRFAASPTNRNTSVGFRLCRTLGPPEDS